MKNIFCNTTSWLRYGVVALCCLSGVAVGNPLNPTVAAGTASITTSGATMTVAQNTPGTIINWADFSIGVGETVSITQPSSASSILIRVTGSVPSQMLGALQSNGRVFIINPAGILLEASATVDVTGLVASTLDLTDQNFMANQLQFSGGAVPGAIANAGSITASPGGSVYLVSQNINNSGVVSAAQGEILLAAGTSVDLTTPSSPLVSDAAGALVSKITAAGKLSALGGAIGIYGGTINLNGSLVDAGSNGTITVNNGVGSVNTGTGVLTGAVTGASLNTALTNNGYVVASGVGSTGTLTYACCLTCSSNATIPSGTLIAGNLITLPVNGGGAITITGTSATTIPNNHLTLASSTVNLSIGWNLIGNSTDTPLDVAMTLGDATKISTVWKWIPTTSKWAFYTPSMPAADLATYAASKGYDVLTTINGGEGFWVNAIAANSINIPAGNAFFPALAAGWNLVSVGIPFPPALFNLALSTTQPATGVIPENIKTLWAWDNAKSNWYFYAPSLEAQGGTALADYITGKGYLDFTANNKTLGQGVGFWVNKP